jgi:hypothetical protein
MADYWDSGTNQTPPPSVNIDCPDTRQFFTQNFYTLNDAGHLINPDAVLGYTHNCTEALWLQLTFKMIKNNRAQITASLGMIENGQLTFAPDAIKKRDLILDTNFDDLNLDTLALYIMAYKSISVQQ